MSQNEMPPPATASHTTPPQTSKKRKAEQESPRKGHLATTEDYQSGDLERRRSAVLADIEYVPRVSVDFFFGAVLPPVSEELIKQVDVKLRMGRHLFKERGDEQHRWKAMPNPPSEVDEPEDVAFAPLVSIYDTIVKFGKDILDKDPTLAFEQKPHQAPISDRSELSRPDGQCALTDEAACQALEDLGILYSYYSHVVSWEFKKEDYEPETIDNIRKVVWSCHNTLLTDPRRRFTFGITIEDTQMTLWYFSRTCIMATHSFDFVKERKTFIHLVLALAFATPEELGFDTTISLHAEILPDQSKVIQFKMLVDGTTYVTAAPLYDYSADAIRGRGMRVWKAYKEDEPDVFVAIKDVWILSGSVTEGDQLRRLYDHLKDIPPSADGRKPTDYFLSLLTDEFVKLSDGKEDDTHSAMMRNQDIPVNAGYMPLSASTATTGSRPSQPSHPTRIRGTPTHTMRSHAAGLPPAYPRPVQEPIKRSHSPRIHYRIVFKGVGITIYNLSSLSDVLNAIADAVEGLKILHSLQLVHRDITPANILVIGGIGKLSDLEYMKSVNEDGPAANVEIPRKDPEHKTAALAFLSVEVVRNKYLFLTKIYTIPNTNKQLSLPTPPDFRFNSVHDLESIFWIVLWTLAHKKVEATWHVAQDKVATRYFSQTDPDVTFNRFDAIAEDRHFDPEEFPNGFSHAVDSLILAQQVIRQTYHEFETAYALHLHTHENTTHFTPKFGDVHGTLIDLFRQGAQLSNDTGFYVADEDVGAWDNGQHGTGGESQTVVHVAKRARRGKLSKFT